MMNNKLFKIFGLYIIVLGFLICVETKSGLDEANSALSCLDVDSIEDGKTYWIDRDGPDGPAFPFQATCNTGGWTRIARVYPQTTGCGPEWFLNETLNTCSRKHINCGQCWPPVGACDSSCFDSFAIRFQQVTGYVKALQYSHTDAFGLSYGRSGINDQYVDGVSITQRIEGIRNHIWTYASGLTKVSQSGAAQSSSCPCNTVLPGTAPASWVGSNYHCDSGFIPNFPQEFNLKWGTDYPLFARDTTYPINGCYKPEFPNFSTNITRQTPVNLNPAPIEVRICSDEYWTQEDVGITDMEILIREDTPVACNTDVRAYSYSFTTLGHFLDFTKQANLNTISDQFTFEVWIQPYDSTMASTLFEVKSDTSSIALTIKKGCFAGSVDYCFSVSVENNGRTESSSEIGSVNVAKWSHVALSVSSTSIQLFVRPTGGSTADFSFDPTIVTIPTLSTIMGESNFQGILTQNFLGQVDDVRLWNVALTQDQVSLRDVTQLQRDESNLVAYWPLDECVGNTARDMVSGGGNMILDGGNWQAYTCGCTREASTSPMCLISCPTGHYCKSRADPQCIPLKADTTTGATYPTTAAPTTGVVVTTDSGTGDKISDDDSSDGTNVKALVAGIAGGAVGLLCIGIVATLLVYKKKKNQRKNLSPIKSEENPGNFPKDPIHPNATNGALAASSVIVGTSSRSSESPSDTSSGDSQSNLTDAPDIPAKKRPLNYFDSFYAVGYENYIIRQEELKRGKEIGRGTWGVVYKGTYNKTDVAIKVLKDDKISEKEIFAFRSEAKLMIKLPAHPNVVMFRGVTLPPPHFCIITDYCNGGSLYHYLQSHHDIPMKTKVKFLFEISRGMVHLHCGIKGQEIIHRDLATRNILLKDGHALISDFGMSRIKAEAEDGSQTHDTIGPIKWMSPEALMHHQYSTKSDVFSFGVVIWEVMTQEKSPWPGIPASRVSVEVTSGNRMYIPPTTPPLISELMIKCWAQDPIDRPSMSTVCDMLASLTESDITMTAPRSTVSTLSEYEAIANANKNLRSQNNTISQSNSFSSINNAPISQSASNSSFQGNFQDGNPNFLNITETDVTSIEGYPPLGQQQPLPVANKVMSPPMTGVNQVSKPPGTNSARGLLLPRLSLKQLNRLPTPKFMGGGSAANHNHDTSPLTSPSINGNSSSNSGAAANNSSNSDYSGLNSGSTITNSPNFRVDYGFQADYEHLPAKPVTPVNDMSQAAATTTASDNDYYNTTTNNNDNESKNGRPLTPVNYNNVQKPQAVRGSLPIALSKGKSPVMFEMKEAGQERRVRRSNSQLRYN